MIFSFQPGFCMLLQSMISMIINKWIFFVETVIQRPLRLFLIHHCKWKFAMSDHQCSEKLNFLNGFTLRMWNYVSSSWFERLRISDRKFVNHTTEMILWSMILILSKFSKNVPEIFPPSSFQYQIVIGIFPP